jgi:hypothetical protein
MLKTDKVQKYNYSTCSLIKCWRFCLKLTDGSESSNKRMINCCHGNFIVVPLTDFYGKDAVAYFCFLKKDA